MVGPVKAQSLTPATRPVKRRASTRRQAAEGAAGLLQPIKKIRVAEEIADRIRVLILDGTFAAGRPLPGERLLAARFGVSRGSIRDALRMLETIGLIESRHGQGTFARELDVSRLVAPLASVLTYRHDLRDELLDLRRMFEPAVARAAAARVTDADLADLQRIVDTQRRKIKSGSANPERRPHSASRVIGFILCWFWREALGPKSFLHLFVPDELAGGHAGANLPAFLD